jgi:arginyl-tRNA synthetase
LQNEKGNIVADLTAEMGQEKTVLRADGTSIYITQDLALGKIRYEDFCMDRMIYVVGNEQEDHFKALFHLFKKLGYSFADTCYHLSYGMIELPDGKMKSREGNVVDADWLADEMHTRVIELLQERYPALL